MNRRQFLEQAEVASLATALGSTLPFGTTVGGSPVRLPYSQQYPDMLASHLVKQLNVLANHWEGSKPIEEKPGAIL
jgi:hypothetical protein